VDILSLSLSLSLSLAYVWEEEAYGWQILRAVFRWHLGFKYFMCIRFAYPLFFFNNIRGSCISSSYSVLIINIIKETKVLRLQNLYAIELAYIYIYIYLFIYFIFWKSTTVWYIKCGCLSLTYWSKF
jgi:hypothetical protein